MKTKFVFMLGTIPSFLISAFRAKFKAFAGRIIFSKYSVYKHSSQVFVGLAQQFVMLKRRTNESENASLLRNKMRASLDPTKFQVF